MSFKSRPHILMIAHRIPYPPDKGDKIRSYHEFKFLRDKGLRIHLCTFIDDPEDLAHVDTLRAQCETASFHRIHGLPQKVSMAMALLSGKPLTVGAFYKRQAQKYIHGVLSNFPIQSILCFSSPTAEYIFRDQKLHNRSDEKNPLTLVMDLIDVDSDKWRQYAAQADPLRRWIYQLESRRLAVYETRIAGSFNATIVVSDAEASLLKQITGAGPKVHGIPNGVDTAFFHPEPAAEPAVTDTRDPACRLAFCGLMDYHPNVDAVVWFTNEVLPLIRQRLGDVHFHIVGARPAREVQRLQSNPGVRVLGRVEDVRPHVWAADVSVAPIRIARGIQNKVLEAMAMAKPVVATNEAYEGLEAVPGEDLLVANADPKQFAQAVLSLCMDERRADQMGRNARQAVLAWYSWEKQMARLEALL